MGKIDIATKQYMSHKNIIADAFNFYVYGGAQIIKPEKLAKDRYGRVYDAVWK